MIPVMGRVGVIVTAQSDPVCGRNGEANTTAKHEADNQKRK